jgi:hypothetical protein
MDLEMTCHADEGEEARAIDGTATASRRDRTRPRSGGAAVREETPAESESDRVNASGVRRIVEFISDREGEQGV